MARRIGRYEVIAELGRGGFGQVFRCLDPNLGTPVAIKILTADGDAGMMVRFRNEAATSRRLKHPNIVAIYDFGEQDAIPYIVMELLEGEDLHRVIETRRPLSLLHKIGMLSQMAAGLGHAHNEGIIHRDVKPANVMLLHDGTVKMMDFGIALITQSTHSRLTPRGAVIGTFRYMAPEQFRGAEPDARSDIFSYGLIAYELVSGVHPFYATEAAAQMYNILNVEPVPIRQFSPECPIELQTILSRLLLKDPDLRYQSLNDVLADLEPALLKLRESRSIELIEEARSAKQQNQLEKAQGLIREALMLTPALEAAREFREQLQAELRRQQVRPRVEELVKRAREAMAAGNPSEAAQGFESAIGLDPLDTTLRGLLNEARLAAERLREALPLLADADRALSNGDAAAAARIARKAVDLVPALARAKDILEQAETALADERRKLRFAEDAACLRRLIEVHSWNEASELVAALNRDFPDYSEVRILEEKLTAGRKREEDERALAAGVATARTQFRDGDLSGALDGLKLLSVQFPRSADVQSLLNAVQLEIDEKRRRDLVTRSVEEAQLLAAREQFESAVKVLDGALVRYPEDQDLQRERRAVVAASREAAWRAAIQKAITQAEELRSRARYAEAVRLLDSFLPADGGDPAIVALRKSIMAEHEAERRAEELRDVIRSANELIAKNEPDNATRLLQGSPTHVRENSEVTRLLNAAEGQKRLRAQKQTAFEALSLEVPLLCEQGRFDEALRGIERFENQHGGDPGVSGLRNRIRSDQQKVQRNAEELLAQATALISANPLEATVLLGGAPDQLRSRPEIQKLEQAARNAAAEQRNREALAERIALAKTLYAEGRFAEALNLLGTGLQSSPGSADLAHLRAEVLAAQARVQRALALRATIKVRELKSAQEFENAEGALKEALANDPENAELLQLLADVQTRRQQLHAQQIEQERAQSLRETYAKGRQRAGASRRAGHFQAAIAILEDLLQQFPDDLPLQEDLKEAGEARDEHARRERYATERRRAGGFVQARKFDDAIALYQTLLAEFPSDAILGEDLKSTLGARDLQQQREALNREVAELEKLYRKGDARAIQQRASRLPPDLEDARVRELLDWARTELERPQQEHERESAESLRRKRKKRIVIVAVTAGLGLVAILPIVLRKRPGPQQKDLQSQVVPNVVPGELKAGTTTTPEGPSAALPKEIAKLTTPQEGKTGKQPPKEQITPPPNELLGQQQQTPAQPQPSVGAGKAAEGQTSSLPEIVDCTVPEYTLPRNGTLSWSNSSRGLEPNGNLVIGGPDGDTKGWTLTGRRFPGCEIKVKSATPGIDVMEAPSLQNRYSRVKLHNSSNSPVYLIKLEWSSQ